MMGSLLTINIFEYKNYHNGEWIGFPKRQSASCTVEKRNNLAWSWENPLSVKVHVRPKFQMRSLGSSSRRGDCLIARQDWYKVRQLSSAILGHIIIFIFLMP